VKARRDLESSPMLKVLIAENDLLMADMLEEVLVENGYAVCGIARTVEEGIALAEAYLPDLALLDLRLAAGGLGTEIAARLDRRAGLGILYATGNAGQISLSKEDGEAVLAKPYRPADVVRALQIVEEIVRSGNATPPFPTGFQLLKPPASAAAKSAAKAGIPVIWTLRDCFGSRRRLRPSAASRSAKTIWARC